MEVWKDIVGYEGLYQVSNLGRVKSLKRNKANNYGKVPERVLKQQINKKSGGYSQASLCKEGKYKVFFIHRLVARAFIHNPDNKPVVNHKDGNKHNNCVGNLEWCTQKENVLHSFVTGLNVPIDERKSGVWTVVVEVRNGKYNLIEYYPSERNKQS